MSQPRVLFVCHNHPDLHPGGTEIFSHGLFQAMKSQHGIEAVYLACVNKVHRGRLPGTLLQSAGPAADEILLWAGHFDRFTLSQVDLHGIVPEFERLLLAFRPDIVHFHHVLLMGIEALQVVRRVLPEAGIVLTLHDYYPICANDGQMVTTRDRKLCRTASADSCAACFPETSRDRFVMRELFIKQNLSLVDRFISPSEFLKRRYVEWGLPADRIDVVRNGVRDTEAMPHRPLPLGAKRDRFAFFGHLNPFKGGLVAIDAAKRLAQKTGVAPSLTLHGSADFQTDAFKAELAKASDNVPFIITRGRYTRDELPALMAEVDWVIMPSIWWENAPLIIQEAFQHHRPVICSNIGGMAEAVRDGVDGLWFNASDPRHLADKMEEALNPELWTKLVAGINPPRRMSESADEHLQLYHRITATRHGVPYAVAPAPRAAQPGPRPVEQAPGPAKDAPRVAEPASRAAAPPPPPVEPAPRITEPAPPPIARTVAPAIAPLDIVTPIAIVSNPVTPAAVAPSPTDEPVAASSEKEAMDALIAICASEPDAIPTHVPAAKTVDFSRVASELGLVSRIDLDAANKPLPSVAAPAPSPPTAPKVEPSKAEPAAPTPKAEAVEPTPKPEPVAVVPQAEPPMPAPTPAPSANANVPRPQAEQAAAAAAAAPAKGSGHRLRRLLRGED